MLGSLGWAPGVRINIRPVVEGVLLAAHPDRNRLMEISGRSGDMNDFGELVVGERSSGAGQAARLGYPARRWVLGADVAVFLGMAIDVARWVAPAARTDATRSPCGLDQLNATCACTDKVDRPSVSQPGLEVPPGSTSVTASPFSSPPVTLALNSIPPLCGS